MDYVLDSSAIQYMLELFPRRVSNQVWEKFTKKCKEDSIVSDKETKKALDNELTEKASFDWVDDNRDMFISISEEEANKLGKLVDSGCFSFYNDSIELSRKLPYAVPFLLVIALVQKRTLVIYKGCRNKDIIKNICDKEHINLVYVEEFLLDINKG